MSIRVTPDQVVRLRTDAGQPVEARLESVAPGALTVAVSVPTAGLAGADVHVELLTVRGVYRIDGQVLADAGPDHRLTVATLGTAALDQRRESCRVDTIRRLDVRGPSGRGISHTLNVSADGMLVAALDTLSVGDELAFGLDLAGEHPLVRGKGTVVRLSRSGARGVRVGWEDPAVREAVISFVFEQQRAREDA